MARGAIIDVDHLSDRSMEKMLTLAEYHDYPLVASHAGFNEINDKTQDHEGQLSLKELDRLQRLGGMVGLITGQGNLEDVKTYLREPGRHRVDHVCGRTTETFAQAYYYAIDSAPGMSIGIGTDYTALKQPGPRFGPLQCAGNGELFAFPRDPSRFPPNKFTGQLLYPFVARGSGVKLSEAASGDQTWDFNVDGLVHVGLVPDFLADLEVLGIPAVDLDRIFQSAEGYVRLWEKTNLQAERFEPYPIFVDSSFPCTICGDGTPENPYNDLGRALVIARDGAHLMLRAGTYQLPPGQTFGKAVTFRKWGDGGAVRFIHPSP